MAQRIEGPIMRVDIFLFFVFNPFNFPTFNHEHHNKPHDHLVDLGEKVTKVLHITHGLEDNHLKVQDLISF